MIGISSLVLRISINSSGSASSRGSKKKEGERKDHMESLSSVLSSTQRIHAWQSKKVCYQSTCSVCFSFIHDKLRGTPVNLRREMHAQASYTRLYQDAPGTRRYPIFGERIRVVVRKTLRGNKRGPIRNKHDSVDLSELKK